MAVIRSDAFGPTYSDRDRVLNAPKFTGQGPRRESDPFGSGSTVRDPNGATHKQIVFLVKIASERGVNLIGIVAEANADGTLKLDEQGAAIPKISKRDASTSIDKFLQMPKVAAPVKPNVPAARRPAASGAPITEEGMYQASLDGGPVMSIYKVQRAVHGSGKLYAKVLVIDVEPVRDADGTVIEPAECHFDYAPGVIYRLRPEHKMTIEQMKNFGALYGSCCFCAKTLTDEDSIFNGYGRKCAGNRGLPYEKAPKIKL